MRALKTIREVVHAYKKAARLYDLINLLYFFGRDKRFRSILVEKLALDVHAHTMKMDRTIENLKDAFAGESKANRRYLAFAQKAEKEGLTQIAKLFRAAAEAETIHALNHLRTLGEIESATENLDSVVSEETFELDKMYPKYLSITKQEGNHQATWSFDVANKVEQVHAGLFSKATEALKNNRELAKADYFVCSICGNTVEELAPEKCPICGAPKTDFFKVD